MSAGSSNILFLSHYFPPEVNAPATRTYEHCRVWAEQDNVNVTVVTCFPNHPNGKIYPGFKNKLFQREIVDGIQVFRVWSYLAANQGFAARILNYLSYMFMAILVCLFKRPKADVVVSTSPQFFCGLAGYFVSRLLRAKWILEIRDLWPESIVAVGAMKDSIMIRFLYRLELFCYKKCNHIVAVTDSFKEYMKAKGIPEHKISVIKNGVNLQFYDQSPTNLAADEVTAFKNKYKLDGKFVAAYVGTHGMAHHLETVLEAAQLTKDEPDIVYMLVGDGAEKKKLAALANELGVNEVVRFVPQLPKSMMPVVWSVTDVSIVHLKRSPTFETVIPSKIFECLAMKKPVILGVKGESEKLIKQGECGITIEPESATEMASAIRLLKEDKQRFNQLAGNGRAFVEENFNRSKLALTFLQLIAGNQKLNVRSARVVESKC